MVDREARNKAAELFRHFVAGQITNDELCNNLPRSRTDGTYGELENWIEFNYEGIWCKPYCINSEIPLTRDERRDMARVILFLHTDLEYEYPSECWGLLVLASSIAAGWLCYRWTGQSASFTFGAVIGLSLAATISALFFAGRILKCIEQNHLRANDADESLWPFYRRSDYEEALRHPKLLCGREAA